MTDPILTPSRSGISFGRVSPSPLAEEVANVPPSLPQAAVGVAASAVGSLIAQAGIPWQIKALGVGVPLALIGWRWIRKGSRRP